MSLRLGIALDQLEANRPLTTTAKPYGAVPYNLDEHENPPAEARLTAHCGQFICVVSVGRESDI